MCAFSHVQLFATLWIVARQAPLSMGFFRQEYWSGLPFPPPGNLPNPGNEPVSPALTSGSFTTEPSGKTAAKMKKERGFLLQGEVLPENNPRATGEDSGEIGDKVDVYPAGNFILILLRTRIYRVPLTLVFSSLAPSWRWWVTVSSFGKGARKDREPKR